MPNNKEKSMGPPQGVIQHLVDVHTKNDTLDKLLESGIGGEIAGELSSETGALGGYTPQYGNEPWLYDGETLLMMGDINPGTGSSLNYFSQFSGFAEYDGKLYFSAYEPATGEELWVYDPALNTVEIVADIRAGSSSSFPGYNQNGMSIVQFDGKLYFNAFDPTYGDEIRIYDASTDALETIDIRVGSLGSQPGFYGGLVEFNGELFFGAYDATVGREVFKYDPISETVLSYDVVPGTDGSTAGRFGFHEYNGNLYFSGFTATQGFELMYYDPGTDLVEIVDINTGSGGSNAGVTGYFNYAGKMFFNANDGTGEQLHSIDANGDLEKIDTGFFVPGTQSGFIEYGGKLFFNAYEASTGTELKSYDDADGSTTTLDFVPGIDSSSTRNLFVYDEKLFFTATDAAYGTELRAYDIATGMIDTFDFVLGATSSQANVAGEVNGKLIVYSQIDEDRDGVADSGYIKMLVAEGPITSIDDFSVVDNLNGSFSPATDVFIFDSDLIA